MADSRPRDARYIKNGMRSALEFRGHPLHVILVDFPIAFWMGSLLADAAHWWYGGTTWFTISWYLMAGGVVGAVLAAAPGIVDYFLRVPPGSDARSAARTHGLLNGGLTVLYAGNLWWRTGPGAAAGTEWWIAVGLSVAGVLVLSYTGWLGGELVYRYHMGIHRKNVEGRATIYDGSRKAGSGSWVEVAEEGELEAGQLKHVIVNGTWIVLARSGTGYHALEGTCSHEGGPLCDGTLMGTTLQCPWHGSRFDVRTGAVEGGPAEKPMRTFGVRVEKGRVELQAP